MSSLVASMSVEESRSFFRVPKDISLELLGMLTFSIVGQANNAISPWSSSQMDSASPFRC